ncbi:peroxiredoxin, SACOL1771 subfamily [Psychrobacillus sp. OK028]|uniref:OsmC family protein n=1 Tax=Psychrobacillus sp. OK028 TaxID=1884359 RepID=UPI00088B8157|nr:OsmC family protein [Psychrobacillus sp. OK028]SDN05830.1 peroxiredoxin, SACOL1771 subfamily [Psychrobacillus sp. OK028]
MTEHNFHLKANWPGNRNDIGTIHAQNLQTKISIPTEMDGPGIGTNPDEMLLGAATTCYIITLAAMLERSRIEKRSLIVESSAVVDVTNGIFTYKKIIHRPTLEIVNERDAKMANRLLKKAEDTCMISKALKGNVEIVLEPTLIIAPHK